MAILDQRLPPGARLAVEDRLRGVAAELSAGGLSARTVRIAQTVMSQSLEQSRKWGVIARNP